MGGIVQNMKIGKKLALSFGAILLIMAALIIIAIMNMVAIHGDLERIVKVNNSRLTRHCCC